MPNNTAKTIAVTTQARPWGQEYLLAVTTAGITRYVRYRVAPRAALRLWAERFGYTLCIAREGDSHAPEC